MPNVSRPRVALIGGGGHAVSLLAAGFDADFIGYVDRCRCQAIALPWLGDDAAFCNDVSPTETLIHIAVISASDCSMALRRSIISRYAAFRAATLVAPSAIVSPGSTIGEGSALLQRTVLNGATLGHHCVLNTGAIVEHGCCIGDNVFIGPGAVVCGGVTIGHDCYIGAGAVLRNGISIAPGTTIGMGAVVLRDIAEPGRYAGNPCKKI